MKKIVILLIFIFFANISYSQFYAGKSYLTLERYINQVNSTKVSLLNAPLEYDRVGEFTGHSVQYTALGTAHKFIVKINSAGIVTECIYYCFYNTNNAAMADIIDNERNRVLNKYRTLNGTFRKDNEYTIFTGSSFIGIICTDNNKPFLHYEALK